MIKNKLVFNDATDWIFDLEKAKDCKLWTKDGKELIDFTSAWNVVSLGWNNQEISEAMEKQIKDNVQGILWSSDDIQIRYADALTKVLPKELDTVTRATGGTEANEEALKTARAFTGRKKFISFRDTYHGQSFGAMAIGYRPEFVTAIEPLVPGFTQIDFPQTYRTDKTEKEVLADFANTLEPLLAKKDVAALVTEAGIITGWGSTYVAPKGYMKLVRELTQKYGTLIILDEIGTGFSRCGEMFGMEIENVVPDIVTFAKGSTNGAAALGTMVTRKEIIEATVGKTNLTSTFGWMPVGCVAALKVLEIHQRDRIWEKAQKDGKYIMDFLKEKALPHPKVGDIRGLGMEIGLDIVKDKTTKEADPESAKKLVQLAYQNSLHTVLGDGGNIQLMPPLVISRELLDKGLSILFECLQRI